MKKCVGLSLILEPKEDTNLVITRWDYERIIIPREASSEPSPEPTKYSLYLFYENFGSLKRCHTLYKVEINLKTKKPRKKIKAPSQILLEFPHGAKGMRCALLESKIYFLGGSIMVSDKCSDVISPRDVFVFDILTNEFEKMDVQLNAGKPHSCEVFTVNGKLYAIPTIPYLPRKFGVECELLFECFDPTIGRWQVLKNLPPVKEGCYVTWFGSTVLPKRQQVVLFGSEHPENRFVKFVYHLYEDQWTRQIITGFPVTQDFQKGDEEDYLYGIVLQGPPIKSKLDYLSCEDERKLYWVEPVDGVFRMSIPGKLMLEHWEWADWVDTYFGQPYIVHRSRLLRHLGHKHFYYAASGMLPGPDARPYSSDPFTRGILITLFKELTQAREGKFQVEILRSQRFEISEIMIPGTRYNKANLVGCYVYAHEEQLQQNPDKKKKKRRSKKKNNNSSDP